MMIIREHRARGGGFTVVELIIVLMLLGNIALAAMPVMNRAYTSYKLESAAREIIAALEFAQMRALTTGAETRVTFDTGADTCLVEQLVYNNSILNGGGQLAESVVETGAYTALERPLDRGRSYRIDLQNENRFAGVDITAAVFGTDSFVAFDALGTPSINGRIELVLGGHLKTVKVRKTTGRAVITD